MAVVRNLLIRAGADFSELQKEMQKAQKYMKDAGKQLTDIGKTLTLGVTAPIVGIGTAALKAQIDWESAFAGVKKTIDGTTEQMKALEEGIISMSKEVPSSATEIASVAEAAGQLGIQTDNILGFTKVIIDLGNATNLTGEEGASSLAKFANITGMAQTEFDRLGSTIVALGNNSATTEADIVAMAMRLAGAGTQVGMTEAQILSMSAALSSVGIEAEAGGSAFSKVLVEMQLAVETGSESLNDFASVAGMTTDEFSRAFKEDATSALTEFIKGLSNAEANGSSAIKVLDDMGITEVRLRDSLLRAGSASELFTDTIALGSKAWEENTALTDEASQRYATTESQIAMLKNEIVDMGRKIGKELLPVFKDVLSFIKGLIEKFNALGPEVMQSIIKFSLIAAAVGPVLLVLGKLTSGLGAVMKWGKGVSLALDGVQKGTKGVGVIMKAVFGPGGVILLIIAAVALLVGAFIYLWNNCETFRNFFINMWNAIVEFITPILTTIKDFIIETWNNIWSFIEPILINLKDTIINTWDYVWTSLQPIIESLKTMFSEAWEFIKVATKVVWDFIKAYFTVYFTVLKGIFDAFVSIIKWIWENFGDIIVQKFKIAWDTVVGVFNGVVKVITGIFQLFTGLLTGNWSKCWEGIKNIVVGVWEGIKSIVKGGINFLITALNGFIRGINKVKVPSWIPGIGGKGITISEIPYLAKGTDYFQGGLAIVGEEGPELVSMPTGAKVTPNNETMNILGNKEMQFNFIMDGRQFARVLAKYNGEEQATFNLRTGGAY